MIDSKQGPVLIIEPCGCTVDHGIPRRCPTHALNPSRGGEACRYHDWPCGCTPVPAPAGGGAKVRYEELIAVWKKRGPYNALLSPPTDYLVGFEDGNTFSYDAGFRAGQAAEREATGRVVMGAIGVDADEVERLRSDLAAAKARGEELERENLRLGGVPSCTNAIHQTEKYRLGWVAAEREAERLRGALDDFVTAAKDIGGFPRRGRPNGIYIEWHRVERMEAALAPPKELGEPEVTRREGAKG